MCQSNCGHNIFDCPDAHKFNENIGGGKITLTNCTEPEIQAKYSEFFKKIRESEAFIKCFVLRSMRNMNIPKRQITKAYKEYKKAREDLALSMNEWYFKQCLQIVILVIDSELSHMD